MRLERAGAMSELDDALEQSQFDFANFSIESLNAAQWALRKLGSARAKIAEATQLANDEKARIDAWLEDATKGPRDDERFFENSLKAYMVRVREETGEKSISLPNGELSSRSLPAKAQVTDLATFIKWCHNNGRESWVRVKEDANLSELKEFVAIDGDMVVDTQSGEVIDGLAGIEADVSVKVDVTPPK